VKKDLGSESVGGLGRALTVGAVFEATPFSVRDRTFDACVDATDDRLDIEPRSSACAAM
jgi:hypothetical protein